MKTNAIKQILNMFYSLKCLNTDFHNFPLYFLKFPLCNVRGLGGTSLWSSELIFMFLESVEEGEWENT